MNPIFLLKPQQHHTRKIYDGFIIGSNLQLKMTYTGATILTEETVPQYLAERANEIGIFAPDAKLTAKAILGGNVNYAFCATEEGTNKTIFVKQAPEFVAVFGPDGLPLTSSRMKQEIAVFEEWKNLLGPELCAKYLPNIYLFDSESRLFGLFVCK